MDRPFPLERRIKTHSQDLQLDEEEESLGQFLSTDIKDKLTSY